MHAYFDCFSGISGDMVLGALIDLGVSPRWLEDRLRQIPLEGFNIDVGRVTRHGIGACGVTVGVSGSPPSRNWTDIRRLLEDCRLPDSVKRASLSAFERIAVAEAGIHHSDVDEVHFHELGGVDALVDIVGAMLCIRKLGIASVTASRIALGTGSVICRHGVIPVPSPATVAILKDIPVYGTGIKQELTTPTGAAIVAAVADEIGPLPLMTIRKVGYGAGKRDLETTANLLRIIIGKIDADRPAGDSGRLGRETVVVVETVIDDMNPEIFGYLMEKLYEDGVHDVCWLPAQMKKNRPGTLVQVVCPPARTDTVIHRLLKETTSLGVRYHAVQRKILFREAIEKPSSYGTVRAKRVVTPDGKVRFLPEYEACRQIAIEQNRPLRDVYETLSREMNADMAA
ncbi:MAG: nickel pincer cofactor biosynthesis protein LarC [Deltaproteobacteria bacterium]|nr:MAG: nickel pincer cofactor biosynthesis protein LarC [Deltaproteobacteria bacterium]